jgi:hypothetical protein
MAQTSPLPPPGSTGPTYPDEDIAKLYNAIPSDAIMSQEMVNDAELNDASRRIKLKEVFITSYNISFVSNDPCAEAEMQEICNYAGADTIRKVRTLSWVGKTGASDAGAVSRVDGGEAWKYRLKNKFGWDVRTTDPRRANRQSGEEEFTELTRQVLDYGIRQNLQRHYGEKGASDEQEAVLNGGASSTSKIGKLNWSITTRSGFGCGLDEKNINFGWGSSILFPKHRLTTCRAYFSKRLAFWVWSIEGATEISHSRFARKIFLWIPTGAENISANSVLAGSGNLQANSNKYYSPVSLKFKALSNGSPMSINAYGAAASLGTGFNVTM